MSLAPIALAARPVLPAHHWPLRPPRLPWRPPPTLRCKPNGVDEDEEELGRLKASAVAAWLVNVTLVAWIVWLYQRSGESLAERDDRGQIVALLSQELADASTALTSDRRLLRETDDITALAGEPAVAPLRALLARRDAELQREYDTTNRQLQEVTAAKGNFDIAGALTSSASGVLAGLDLTIALQIITLALVASFARGRFAAAKKPAEDHEQREERLQSTNVVRFYGRWDDETEWVLVQSVVLKGTADSVIGTVRNSRGWLGSWSDRIITALVARSARGMVRRRGWKRIVEQTMAEVGRTFTLGYLVETAADKALPRIGVESGRVLEVPSTVVLDA